MIRTKGWLAGIMVLALTACKVEKKADTLNAVETVRIVCTTGMIADAVKAIAGESATVTALMGPGVDPHLYQPAQADMKAISEAHIIVYNGLHLEGKMTEVLESIKRRKHVFAMADALDASRLIRLADFEDAYDPHIWFDVALWKDAVQQVGNSLQHLLPAKASRLKANQAKYITRLNELDQWCRNNLAHIPSEKRILVTAHDAFAYFGRAYQVEVRGLQGISTTAGIAVKDVKDLVTFLVEKQVHTLFLENSVPQQAMHSVLEGCRAQQHPIRVGATLYSDAMGATGTPEGTYIGMIRYNVTALAEAFAKTPANALP